ncbi:MAG: hypothetical protein WAT39_01020, partial [Planctomycetota bacterium]
MRIVSFVSASLLFACAADLLPAQGRGRGRAEEINNRVGAFFTDTKGPAPEGDKAGDLAKADMVRAAAGVGQLSVLYLVNGSDDADVRDTFERTVLGGDEIGIMLRCFHCGRVDLKDEPALAAKFGKQAPLFVAFDKDGKAGDIVAMAGYKAQPKALETVLVKAAQGTIKPSLTAFAKDYGGLVRDLEQVLNKKKLAKERLAKAGADKEKRADCEKDLAGAEKDEQKLVEQESTMLGRIGLPDRPEGARRLGGRN